MDNAFSNLMQKAVQAQEKVKKIHEELNNQEIIGEAGAGTVKLVMTGSGEAKELIVDDSIYNEDKKVLKGLIVHAINDAKIKQERLRNDKLKDVMGGILPPGFNLPI